MQQRTVISNGKRYIVNVATDDGIGAGFAAGQLVMKSYTDKFWYIITASGSAGAVVAFVTQSALPFPTSSFEVQQSPQSIKFITSSFYFDQNTPYQLLGSTNGYAYQVYLTGTAPTVAITISQSAYSVAFVTSSLNVVHDIAKPFLLLQNITDGNYYKAYLQTVLGTTSMVVDQAVISQSWVNPIY